MAYTPPSGGSVGLSLEGGYRSPSAASLNLEFDAAYLLGRLRAAGGFDASALPGPRITLKSRPLKASGSRHDAHGKPSIALDIPRVRPAGIDATAVAGTPEYVRWRRFVEPGAINEPPSFVSVSRVRLPGGYNPPPGGSLVVNWFAEPYSPPPGGSVQLVFGALGYGYVWTGMGEQTSFGQVTLFQPTGIRPGGIDSAAFGAANVQTSLSSLRVSGFTDLAFGTAALNKSATALYPGGIAAATYGATLIYNLRQYLTAPGTNALAVGSAFVSGGVKLVTPGGFNALSFGGITVINTTANQTAKPLGIAPPAITGPVLSPRMVYPAGVVMSVMGAVTVQRNPAPYGFDASLFGQAGVEYKTKYLVPGGIASPNLGYPVVFDPTQKLFPPSMVEAGLFGDTRVANKSLVARVPGFDSLEVSPWAQLESNRRYVLASGIASPGFGASTIANKTPSVIPPGFDALRAPSPTETGIGFARRTLYLSGIPSPGIGSPVLTKTPEILPAGITGAMGVPTVWPRIRNLDANGANSQAFGAATLWFRFRYVPMQGKAQDTYGTPKVEHWRRELIGAGTAMSAYGAPVVTNADRTIAPPSIFQFFASSHMVGGLRFLRPVGFDAAQFGARIIPEIQQAYPLGFAGSYGLPTIRNSTQLVAPPGFITVGQQPADRWGTAKVYNLVQYISMFYDPDSALNPPAWPQWTLIENRNRKLLASGLDLGVIGQAQIDNNARPLLAEGIAAPDPASFYKAGLVAYRVRYLPLEGMEAPYLAGWATIYNDAAVLSPQGFDAQAFAPASLANTRRFLPPISAGDQQIIGLPMIADRVRTLDIESRYSIGAPTIQLPEVKLHTRYAEARGADMSGLGWASLSIHWTLITPRWTLQNLYGSPTVWNVTPELRAYGSNAEVFGDTFVRLQWRPVAPDGALTQQIGRVDIAYRNRSLFPSGLRAWAFGDKLTVVRTVAPPYSTQYIYLDGTAGGDGQINEGNGIEPPLNNLLEQTGRPTFNQKVIYVHQDEPMTKFGAARVAANSVRVEPGYWELLVGEPMVGLKIRTLAVAEYEHNEQDYRGKPRLDPLTIWAVMEAPTQARQNHSKGTNLPLHYVDGYRRQPGVIFGTAQVMNQHRSVSARGWSDGAGTWWSGANYGRPALMLRRQVVSLTGFTSFRSGWHMLPGEQTAEQYESTDGALYGRPTVARPPNLGPQTVKPSGLLATAFDKALVEFFNREVKPSGYLATLMGTRKPGDTPYMWQGLRVGPLMPTIPMGIDSQAVGTPWVSFRVRELKLEGFDAFRLEYELEAFDRRMRVWRREAERPRRTITPVGIAAFESAASDVKPGVHFIRPDGNADQFRKGAF